ncbi:MAG: tRNA lysidine(34) synthetase TilS [Deltaproteobacteria bacterium]|nr:tRNA lysidine(34) synthetase TilS [Deltaproteobacteria bacterium]
MRVIISRSQISFTFGAAMLIEKVKKTVSKFGMLKKGESVLVAVSGGVDSVVLLRALSALKDRLGLTLMVAHVNHNLRGAESKRDFLFVKKLAAAGGLEFAGVTLKRGELKKRGESLQALARDRRLEFLSAAAERFGAARIALGHNADDQAETVLMRFLKGSGLRGLAGMAPVRGRFIRPLIACQRAEIERFAAEQGIKYVTDSSNLGMDYLRNDVRLRLLPFIKKRYNPNIIETLARTAGILREDGEFMRARAAAAFSDAATLRKRGFVSMDRLKLSALHPAISKRVFLDAVWSLEKDAQICSAHADAYVAIVKAASPSASCALPGGLILRRVYNSLIISREKAGKPASFDVAVKTPGKTLIKDAGLNPLRGLNPFKGLSISATVLKKPPAKGFTGGRGAAYFDYALLPGPVRARTIKPGDRMIPFGMDGHKKLKEILIEEKIPARLRPLVPVVYAGTEIIWLAGLKQSDRFKVTRLTKKILMLEMAGGRKGGREGGIEIFGNI